MKTNELLKKYEKIAKEQESKERKMYGFIALVENDCPDDCKKDCANCKLEEAHTQDIVIQYKNRYKNENIFSYTSQDDSFEYVGCNPNDEKSKELIDKIFENCKEKQLLLSENHHTYCVETVEKAHEFLAPLPEYEQDYPNYYKILGE